jgi:signal transduction histidine kinase/ligand-binding sensor domain-containing protein
MRVTVFAGAALVFCGLCCIKGSAVGQVHFQHITTDDGLLSGNVRAILQDHQGFLWIGTEDGLHRYDGYTLRPYLHSATDSTSLSSDAILYLFEDSFKNLWIGTRDGGLNYYDRRKDNFLHFTHHEGHSHSLAGKFVRVIYESRDHVLYVGLEEGSISYFPIPQQVTSRIAFENQEIGFSSQGANWVSSIIEDPYGHILVGVNGGGIKRFDPATRALAQVLQDSCSNRIQALHLDSRNRLWIGSWDDGLFVYDFQSRLLRHHPSKQATGYLAHHQVENIVEDSIGNFWIGTDNGLCLLRADKDPLGPSSFITYRHEPLDARSLLSNSIKASYLDKLGRLWVGSYYGGVNVFDRRSQKFNPVRSKSWKEESLSNNNVFAFAFDKQDRLWVGTDGGGLNLMTSKVLDDPEPTFRKVTLNEHGLPADKIKCIQKDHTGNFWIGTWGSGLFHFNPDSEQSTHYGRNEKGNRFITSDEVLAIQVDHRGNVWLGTFSGGLLYMNPTAGVLREFKNLTGNFEPGHVDKINAVLVDSKDRVWAAPEVGGLTRYDSATGQFEAVAAADLGPLLTLLAIYEDRSGMLWLGTTSSGIIRYDPSTGESKSFDSNSGLPNNLVHAIVEDSTMHTLWLSTNKGLSAFDLTTHTIVNYSKSDGLQGNQFNNGSVLRHPDGHLFFGGISGYNVFLPSSIARNHLVPTIAFTQFWLNNVEMRVREGSPLKENISLSQALELAHYENSFSIEFSMLEYDFSRRNQYQYLLENFDTAWHALGTERKITFTNLDPGKYTLHVRASNADGFWSAEPRSIKLVIRPAWYQNVLFKLGSVLFITSMFVAIFLIRLHYLSRQKEKLQNLVDLRTEELREKNAELAEHVKEIDSQNKVLHLQKFEIAEKNQEIQAQNEELIAQNDQIMLQRERLEEAWQKLQSMNNELEIKVQQRTYALQETIAQLDKTVAELDRFVYSASHDLSAPLKSILGLVQIARIEKDPGALPKYYTYIEQSIRKLDRVIKSLVEFARNTHHEIVRTPFSLSALINEITDELAYWPETRQVEIHNEVADTYEINSDKERIKVVLQNLISNSIKYSDTSKHNRFIRISSNHDPEHYSIYVSDNGIGIDPEKQGKIFNMYYRASERSQGSGLGLFIVKEILDKLGGTVEVSSKPGVGSDFSITLPR